MIFRPSRAASSIQMCRWARHVRHLLVFAGLAALSACAGQRPVVDNKIEAQHYAEVAKGHYTPPGPPDDPWGPYVTEASARYDVPQIWIRGVMRQESSGLQFQSDGTLTISDKGAMGLMQVMPETYDELRGRYGLGDDPYDPHNNILAGAAYMRELYDLYGSPAFLAAYNAGPGRLDKYLAGTQALPDETRRYVAMIAPNIAGVWPSSRSPAEQLAVNHIPIDIPPGLRYARQYGANGRHGRHGGERAYAAASKHGKHAAAQVQYAALSDPGVTRVAYRLTPAPQPPAEPERLQFAAVKPHGHGFRLISTAVAEPLPFRRGGGTADWAIQVGAFGNQGQARAAADAAHGVAAGGRSAVGAVHGARGTLYRARLTGLSREAAVSACERMHKGACVVLSPAAQS
jgi:hypothetical protein